MSNKSNDFIIEVLDENQNTKKYKLLDVINYDDNNYAVMLSEPSDDGMVEIFSIEHSEDKSSTKYLPVTNNYIVMQVYETFKENVQEHYSDYIKIDEDF